MCVKPEDYEHFEGMSVLYDLELETMECPPDSIHLRMWVRLAIKLASFKPLNSTFVVRELFLEFLWEGLPDALKRNIGKEFYKSAVEVAICLGKGKGRDKALLYKRTPMNVPQSIHLDKMES